MKDQLQLLLNRGQTLCGFEYADGSHDLVPVDASRSAISYLRDLAASPFSLAPDPKDTKEITDAKKNALETLRSALKGNEQAKRDMAAIRLETVDNYVRASSNFMSFFNVISLKDNEQPYIQNTTSQEIRVLYLSEDGEPKQVKAIRPTAEAAIELRQLTTEPVWYRTRDIYKGNIADLARKTFDLGFDAKNGFDRTAYTLMTTALNSGGPYGTFSLTGSKVSRIYVPNSLVITSHLPTTNDLTVKRRTVNTKTGQVVWLDASDAVVSTEAAAATNGFFGLPVLQDIVRYCTQWGDIFPDGPLQPTGEIVVPAIDIQDILTGLGTVQVNVQQTSIQEQVQKNGFANIGHWFGVDWKLVPDVTIPSGTCYPKLNKSAGNVYLKPSMDEEFTETDNTKHTEKRWQTKVFGITIIGQRRYNMLRLTYK